MLFPVVFWILLSLSLVLTYLKEVMLLTPIHAEISPFWLVAWICSCCVGVLFWHSNLFVFVFVFVLLGLNTWILILGASVPIFSFVVFNTIFSHRNEMIFILQIVWQFLNAKSILIYKKSNWRVGLGQFGYGSEYRLCFLTIDDIRSAWLTNLFWILYEKIVLQNPVLRNNINVFSLISKLVLDTKIKIIWENSISKFTNIGFENSENKNIDHNQIELAFGLYWFIRWLRVYFKF